MGKVLLQSKSKHGFVIQELRGTLITTTGTETDMDSPLYEAAKVYISMGILIETETGASPAKVEVAAPSSEVVLPQTKEIVDSSVEAGHRSESKADKKRRRAQETATLVEEPAETTVDSPAELPAAVAPVASPEIEEPIVFS